MAFVQQNGLSADASATSIATSLTNVAGGNMIFVAVSHSDFVGPITVDDTVNVYTQIGSTLRDTTNNQQAAIFYAKNVAAGSPTITATYNGTSRNFRRIVAAEYSGLNQTEPLEQNTGQQTLVGSSAPDGVTSTPVVTVIPGQTIIGSVMDTSGITTEDPGTGFTERGEYGSLSLEDMVQSSPGSVAATWTFGAVNAYIAFVATFIPAVVPSTGSLRYQIRRRRMTSW